MPQGATPHFGEIEREPHLVDYRVEYLPPQEGAWDGQFPIGQSHRGVVGIIHVEAREVKHGICRND